MTHRKTEEWSALSHITSDEPKAVTVVAVNRSYQPSTAGAPSSNTALAATPQKRCNAIRLLYDSYTRPPAAGTRSAGMYVRQMLYRTEHYQIDIQLEVEPDSNRLAVVGQLLDTRRPGIVDVGVQVTLSDGRGNMAHTTTNQFGEFRGEVGNSGDLELSFLDRDGKSIIILLRAALGPMARTNN